MGLKSKREDGGRGGDEGMWRGYASQPPMRCHQRSGAGGWVFGARLLCPRWKRAAAAGRDPQPHRAWGGAYNTHKGPRQVAGPGRAMQLLQPLLATPLLTPGQRPVTRTTVPQPHLLFFSFLCFFFLSRRSPSSSPPLVPPSSRPRLRSARSASLACGGRRGRGQLRRADTGWAWRQSWRAEGCWFHPGSLRTAASLALQDETAAPSRQTLSLPWATVEPLPKLHTCIWPPHSRTIAPASAGHAQTDGPSLPP